MNDSVVQQPPVWRDMKTAPKNCSWIKALLPDGTVERVHYACDHSGEEQPPYDGWFKESKFGGFVQVANPVGWVPDTPEGV